jgi:hypothetical protein
MEGEAEAHLCKQEIRQTSLAKVQSLCLKQNHTMYDVDISGTILWYVTVTQKRHIT